VLELVNCLIELWSVVSELFSAAVWGGKAVLTAEIAICPVLYTFLMLEMIALGLPLSFSCATALLKLLTSGQYAAVLLVLAGAVLLVLAGAVLLVLVAVVLLLVLPHPASNAAVRASISAAARR
jgi:hypothetical protein